MSNIILESPRLRFRVLTEDDYDDLARILGDEKTMYAYAHAFSPDEISAWLNNQLRRYREDGFGLWAVESEGRFIGNMGITWQNWAGKRVPEIGYLLCRDEWRKGYATEGARALKDYAFKTLNFSAVYSIIRDNNLPSIRVAERNDMIKVGELSKFYYGLDMPHWVFCALKENRMNS